MAVRNCSLVTQFRSASRDKISTKANATNGLDEARRLARASRRVEEEQRRGLAEQHEREENLRHARLAAEEQAVRNIIGRAEFEIKFAAEKGESRTIIKSWRNWDNWKNGYRFTLYW